MFEHEFTRKGFNSSFDGFNDWYLVRRGNPAKPLIVYLHGHGSGGDQILLRQDIVEITTAYLVENDYSVISPNYRGNSWMCEAAQHDLAQILQTEKELLKCTKVLMISGSMGGTSNLIFAMRHPELVDGVGVMGAATDLGAYVSWLSQQPGPPILAEIRDAITVAFPSAQALAQNSTAFHAERLKAMPVVYHHGGADETIPVEQAHALAEKLRDSSKFIYHEIEGGNHDSPLADYREILQQLLEMTR